MMTDKKESLKKIFAAGVAAVAPDAALLRHLRYDPEHPDEFVIDGRSYDLSRGRIIALGAGKGAAPMAQALEKLLGDKISGGFVVVKDGHELPLGKMELACAAHPVPNEAGARAGQKLLDLAACASPEDLVICVITGGASALTTTPASGLNLEQLREATSLLLASGADIAEINAIRKHLTRFGGGQLARAAHGARVLAIIVSDVIGDDLATIASGPTAPDPSTYKDCLAIIDKYDLRAKMPPEVVAHLQKGAAGEAPETPKAEADFFKNVNNVIVASNEQALAACAEEARKLGYEPLVLNEPMQGEARHVATALIDKARKLASQLKKGDKGICLLAGGETTVTIKGSGKGGRNQEMALAASLALQDDKRLAALFGGTDGSDGPTDAAGGFSLPDFVSRMGGEAKAEAWLEENNSNAALLACGDLLVTGPTLTNVMDLAIVLIDAPA